MIAFALNFHTITPQGDGNVKDTDDIVFPVAAFTPLPRKGTETELVKVISALC